MISPRSPELLLIRTFKRVTQKRLIPEPGCCRELLKYMQNRASLANFLIFTKGGSYTSAGQPSTAGSPLHFPEWTISLFGNSGPRNSGDSPGSSQNMIVLGLRIKVSNVFKIKPKLMCPLPWPWMEKLTLGMDFVLDVDLGIASCWLQHAKHGALHRHMFTDSVKAMVFKSHFVPRPWVPLQETFGNVWHRFWLSQFGREATGIWWVEIREAAKHPAMHRTAPPTKHDLTQKLPVPRPTSPERRWHSRHTRTRPWRSVWCFLRCIK